MLQKCFKNDKKTPKILCLHVIFNNAFSITAEAAEIGCDIE